MGFNKSFLIHKFGLFENNSFDRFILSYTIYLNISDNRKLVIHMTTPDPNKVISLNITQYPMHLLIPSNDNIVSIQAMNYLNQDEGFEFNFEGENLEIGVPEDLQGQVKFGAGETKNFNLTLTPTADGSGKLIITTYWLKTVQYTEKVQKVRDVVPISKITDIFGKYSLTFDEPVLSFNSSEFIITSTEEDIKQAELQLNNKRNSETMSVSVEEIDNDVKNLSKKYLWLNDIEKALEYSLQLSNEEEKKNFYYDLIRAYASIDFDQAIKFIPGLKDVAKKLEIIRGLAIEQAGVNPERGINAALLIEDPQVRENLMKVVIGKIIPLNPSLAANFIDHVNEEGVKINLLLNIIKQLVQINDKSEAIRLLNKTIDHLKVNLESWAYELLKNALQALAELDSPQSATMIIENLTQPDIKERINADIFDTIYEMVDEIKTRIESNMVFSQFFLFNTCVSNINESVKTLSSIGGNLSSNLLIKDNSYRIAIVSLFSYNFSIFPTLERVYTDLNKSIAYYIYPSIDNHEKKELNAINSTLRQFFTIQNMSTQLIVYNLDFIPYLGKPTIILSSEDNINDNLKVKITSALGDSANIHVDDSLFKGGTTVDNLKQVFTPERCKVVNLLLSYEFINDYNVFKTFIQSLI